MKRHLIALLPLLLVSTACNRIPTEAHFNRGAPESLLDVSSEVVTVTLSSERSVDEIVEWVETDQPSRAELYCFDGDPMCGQAEEVFNLYGMEYQVIPSETSEVYLIYERVLARDCENRYIDNSINPYNLSHPTFGCSIAANMVQMVSDKRQFVSPALLDYRDAVKVVNSYNNYVNPVTPEGPSRDLDIENISLE